MQPGTTQPQAAEIRSGIGPVIGEHHGAVRYAAAILLVLVVGGIRYALVPVMGTHAPLLPLLVAVLVAVWLGGRDAGLLATILAALSATFLFTAWPQGMNHVGWGGHLTLFTIAGLAISVGGHRVQILYRSQRDALIAAQGAERQAIQIEIERKQALEKLEDTQRRLSLALRAGRAGTFEWDIAAGIEDWSPELLALHGYSPETFDGSHAAWLERIFPEDREAIAFTVEEALVKGSVATEFRIRRQDTGEIRWMHGRGEVLYDEAGRPRRMLGINADITERKLAQEALRESAQQLRLLTDHLPALISYIDRDGCFRFANAAYAQWFDSGQRSIVGSNIREWLGEEMWHYREPYFQRVLAGEFVQFEAPTMHRTLGLRDCSIVYVPDVRADGYVAGFYVMVHDITEQKRGERAHREQERRLQLIFDSSSDSLCLMAVEESRFRVLSANATFVAAAGLAREQIEAKLISDLLPPEKHVRILSKLEHAVLSRRPVVFYESAPLTTGLRYGEVTVTPICAPDGAVSHVLAAVKDVTEKKKADEALFDANRRKDEFLAMLAHELRNPLAAIRNVSHILGTESLDPLAILRSSELLQRQATQLARLVDDLLDVARITRGAIELQRQPKRLDEVLDAALETAQPFCAVKRQTINVQRSFMPLWITGDAARLTQVFSNLLGNAAKYSPDCAHIELKVERELNFAVVRVRDEGIGIDSQVLPHIFDLFFQADQSLDRAQGGLGVGLTIVRAIVDMHAGQVEARSDGPGKGSEFVVRLPLADETEAESPLVPAARKPQTVPRRILIVEDNADAAQSLAMLLEISGHSVQIARDGPMALTRLESFDAEIIFLDIGLPGADGYIVAQAIRDRFPASTRRLYAVTGYGREEDRTHALNAGFDGHLTKPVDPAYLLSLIDEEPAGSDPALVRVS
jgi:PAS domain S-box-containing protein